MNVISISITGIFVILGIAFTTLLLAAILGNLRTSRRYRQTLSEELSDLRLSGMLKLKGIDQTAYLHTQPVVEIEQQMQRCSGCAQMQRCDTALAASNSETDTGFCDNDAELQAIGRKLGSAA